ncbi:hypothetical protein [Curtobacterium sp. MCBA15_001]|uniref:hypothetical protein n=1 Tax=Curtobacterium sp. MCBA15_001 TaxID=1898731 RepID=UPI0008DE28E5|nr:hypothetical protein [Curtobacterium sp. MCBA15_001]OIH96973.1 hypothetical protein BIU90_15920 [Curtobacterium sp. MCBA15_001]
MTATTALVIGGGGFLVRAVARSLAAAGADVMVPRVRWDHPDATVPPGADAPGVVVSASRSSSIVRRVVDDRSRTRFDDDARRTLADVLHTVAADPAP